MYSLTAFVICFAYLTPCTANQSLDKNIDNYEQPASFSVIQQLIERMNDMELREKILIKSLGDLKLEHQLEINGLKQELAQQKSQIEILQKKSSSQERIISSLKRRVDVPSKSSAKVQGPDSSASISELSGKHKERKQNIFVETKGNRILRAENEVTVAFTAGLTNSFLHAGPHQNIVFDHVETNVGNGYNNHHGVFTAPVSGLYIFYSSILSYHNDEIWCQIVVNGNTKASVYARGTDGRHGQGSQAIIIQLQQGDDVAVQNIRSDHGIFGNADIYTTFSGILLQQSFSSISILGKMK